MIFTDQSRYQLVYIALTTLQIRRLLWDDVESANVCIVRCSIYSCAPDNTYRSLYPIYAAKEWYVLEYVYFGKHRSRGKLCLIEGHESSDILLCRKVAV